MLKVLIPVGIYLNKISKEKDWSVMSFWEQVVQQYGVSTAVVFEDKTWTYRQLDERSNQYAECFLELGIQKGDVVALCLTNCPDFLIILLALFKIGATATLLNPNVTGKPLIHCLQVCGATTIVYHTETLPVIQTIDDFFIDYLYLPTNSTLKGKALHPDTKTTAGIPDTFRNGVELTDTLMHIFTSGTTGLPKAAKINHLRFVGAGFLFAKFSGILSTDRIYCTLPLYHASALLIGWGMCLNVGATFILRKKFSATQFWADCNKYEATIVQYIGELCRYLCNTPETIHDRTHQVRLAIGNGLRPDVWRKFQDRFQVDRIMEFYSATEGNTGFINAENKFGAVGYMSPLIRKKHPAKFIRVDRETMQPMRDPATNACLECRVDEVGELIAEIDTKDVMRRFDGYSDPEETNKKILRSVFKAGDMFFRSGDLMKLDHEGFVYFVDRTGDTYRWRGENVSTAEVSLIISDMPGDLCLDVAVYGVVVGDNEGRAGMAMIYPAHGFSISLLYTHLLQLPKYSRPYFIRVTDHPIAVTETHKHRKAMLAKEGFNPQLIKQDPLYFRDDKVEAFVELSDKLYEEIMTGRQVL